MHPYLPQKRTTSVLQNTVGEDGKSELKEVGENHALSAAADDLIRAVHAKDSAGVAAALEAAHYACSGGDDEFGEV